MAIFITADSHHRHRRIILLTNRTPFIRETEDGPFYDVELMDETLIANWNSVVGPRDTVWHLGDFCLGKDPSVITCRLNGKIHLILGNHDKPKEWRSQPFVSISSLETIRYNKQKITLCHYGLRTWPGSCRGSLHCYGHSHGRLPGMGRSCDVGVDTNNFFPYNLDDVIKTLLERTPGDGERRDWTAIRDDSESMPPL
jgi:calcineurin-like phosphoesterase family protein